MNKSKKFEIRAAYTPREPVHVPLSGEPSRTKQEFKTEVNINEIVARMRRGISPPAWMTSATPRYGDFTDMPVSFQEAHAIMEAGQAAFLGLPLEIRRAIDHDPTRINEIPKELYAKFGLLKPEDPASPAPKAPGSPPVDPSSNEPTGSKKASKKDAPPADE
ncbi:internal scaffolding protein [Apis mellifera associated microvirus 31]|nr:internal scaffolding protein [Apis mellifera associated microvirus 31]